MYSLDTTEARKADQTGNRISEIGKYVGKFTQAEDITASTGTKGVGLRFDVNGQNANLSIYTKKSNGETIMGFQALMAIMTCLGLRNIAPVAGNVTRWNNESKAEETLQSKVFPDLCGKPIGLLLETEGYFKGDGAEGVRMVIAGIFQANTELTASEILDRKTQPEQLEKLVARLHHRPAKAQKNIAPRPASSSHGGGGFEDMDDGDIPFRDPMSFSGRHLAV